MRLLNIIISLISFRILSSHIGITHYLGNCRLASPILLSTLAVVCSAQESASQTATAGAETTVIPSSPSEGYEWSFAAMGTQITFKAFHADSRVVERAFALAQHRVVTSAAILTDYDPQSETSQLTKLATERPARVSNELWSVLEASQKWYLRTDGSFDASLGSLTRLWRKYRRTDRLPSESEIAAACEASGWSHVQLDAVERTIKFDQSGIQLDFGGIGKGYIVDQAYEVLSDQGVTCCLVDISGNMRVGLPPPGRAGWRIGISPLEPGGEFIRHLTLNNQAIATSGDLWQYTVIDGVRHSHILNPRTGYGVVGPIAATVIAPTGIAADALATAACILEFDQIKSIAQHESNVRVLVAKQRPGYPPLVQEYGID